MGHFVDQQTMDYYRSRERRERIAAKESTSLAVRRAHQELALRYAAMLRRKEPERRIFWLK